MDTKNVALHGAQVGDQEGIFGAAEQLFKAGCVEHAIANA